MPNLMNYDAHANNGTRLVTRSIESFSAIRVRQRFPERRSLRLMRCMTVSISPCYHPTRRRVAQRHRAGYAPCGKSPPMAGQDSGEHLALTHGHGIGADIPVTYQMSDAKTVFLPPCGMVGGIFPTYVRPDGRKRPR